MSAMHLPRLVEMMPKDPPDCSEGIGPALGLCSAASRAASHGVGGIVPAGCPASSSMHTRGHGRSRS